MTPHDRSEAHRPRLGAPSRWPFLAWALALVAALSSPAAAQIQINELRVNQPSTDNDEYFELRGPPGTPLTGYTLLVIGDASSTTCGTIEAVIDLGGFSIQADGFFAAAELTVTVAGFDHVFGGINPLNFENSDNVTYMLVTGFSGALLGDIDTNDDGVIDSTPWTTLVDAVGLIGSSPIDCDGPTTFVEHVYTTTTVGPDAGVPPYYVFRCRDTGLWQVGDRSLGVNDTPGAANQSCAAPPPAIQDEARNPCVPEIGATATATVKVRLATSASLHWRVNGGTETVTAMTLASTSGDTAWYDAAIPGQLNNGDRVEYHVVATNANGSDQGFDQGYFVGTTPIGTLRVNDPTGLNLYRFYGARVRGRVTVQPGVFSTVNMDFYVQDATGGINVSQVGPHPEQPQLGDDITVISTISQFNGRLQIGPGSVCDQLDILIHGSGTPPAPILVTTCTPPETYEGMLVRMDDFVATTGLEVLWGSNVNYWGRNCTGNDSIQLFIDVDTNIDGTPITSNHFHLVGIGGQFDLNLPFDGFYEIIPRSLADITYLPPLAVPDAPLAARIWLGPAAPNPMRGRAEVAYRIPGSLNDEVPVRIRVLDLQGRVVGTLFDGVKPPGEHRVTLDQHELGGTPGAMQFLRLEVGGQSMTRKLIYR